MSLVSLGTHIADPARRLAHVMAATAAMKETMGSLKSVLPTDFPSLGVPWLLEAATSLYGKAKVADRLPPLANVVISNVPGPPITLYMAGARMLTNYPTSIVVHGVALNITVQSYDQSMDFGLMADAAAAPDLQALADAIRVALDDLRGLPRPGDADHESTVEPVELVGKAARRIGGAISKTVRQTVGQTVGKVTRSVVGSAVEAAVAGATAGPRKRAAAAAPAARRARR
jgi:diacylglycerol O-acyltransferase